MNDIRPLIDTSIMRDAHALLRGRRSVRWFRPQMPPVEALDRIFASAAMAPSAHNRQPWRYVVATGAATKARLADVMGVRLAADRGRDGDAPDVIQQDVARSYQRITAAPIAIVVATTVADMDSYPDEGRAKAEYFMAAQSTAMATQNLLLAAHAEGLGACWMCAPLFCPSEVKLALGIPEDWHPQGLITLGYPASPGKLKPRKAGSEFVRYADAYADAGGEQGS